VKLKDLSMLIKERCHSFKSYGYDLSCIAYILFMLESQCGGWMSGNIQELSDWQPAPRERLPWLANACNSDMSSYVVGEGSRHLPY